MTTDEFGAGHDGQQPSTDQTKRDSFPDIDYIHSSLGVMNESHPPLRLVIQDKISIGLPENFTQTAPMPDKFVLSLPENLSIPPLRLTLNPPAENLPVAITLGDRPLNIRLDETKKVRFLNFIPVLFTSIAAALTAFVIWKQGNIQKVLADASKTQAEASQLQANTQARQYEDDLSKLRADIFREILDGDIRKKSGALMALAEHGDKTLPVIGQALSIELDNLHENMAEVVYHLFHLEDVDSKKAGMRQKLFDDLIKYMQSKDARLQEGALVCLIRLEPDLNDDNRRQVVVGYLIKHFAPQTYCRDTRVKAMQKAAHFLGLSPDADTRAFLLQIAATGSCGEARRQAVVSLGNEWDKGFAGRDETLSGLQRLRAQVLKEVNDEKEADLKYALGKLSEAIATTIDVIEKSKQQIVRS